MKEYVFVDVNDGSCSKNLQVIVPKDQKSNFNFGVSANFVGDLHKSPRGQLELKADVTNVLGMCNLCVTKIVFILKYFRKMSSHRWFSLHAKTKLSSRVHSRPFALTIPSIDI